MVKNFLSFSLLLLVSAFLIFPAAAEITNPFILPQYSKKVSLDFKDADLKDVLKAFATQINSNFILTSDVPEKMITVFLEDVPVESAFDMLLSANNMTYDYSDANNIFVIRMNTTVTDPVVTKIFSLRYASVSSAKINSTLTTAAASGATSTSGGATPAADAATVGSSTAGISAAIAAVLSKEGKVSEDPRTNSLIVSDLQSNFDSIEKTLARLDVPVCQVQIEVEMLDVSKITLDKLGSKFKNDLSITSTKTKQSNVPWMLYTPGTVNFSAASFALDFLKTQTDTKSLARPKILTLDNETAEIMISTNESVGITSSTDTATTGGQTTYTAERTETGVFLRVTPQVNALTEEITLAVYPRVIEARRGESFDVPGGSVSFKDPEERGTRSILKVKNGDTVLLGGLLRTEGQTALTKVPFLGDIPLLGALFRHKQKDGKERELIIFLTPRIQGAGSGAMNTSSFDINSRERSSVTNIEANKEMDRLGY